MRLFLHCQVGQSFGQLARICTMPSVLAQRGCYGLGTKCSHFCISSNTWPPAWARFWRLRNNQEMHVEWKNWRADLETKNLDHFLLFLCFLIPENVKKKLHMPIVTAGICTRLTFSTLKDCIPTIYKPKQSCFLAVILSQQEKEPMQEPYIFIYSE